MCIYFQINADRPFSVSVVGQVMWREYFYTMSVNNINYNKMTDNPICLNIPWYKDDEKLKKWENASDVLYFIVISICSCKIETSSDLTRNVERHICPPDLDL